MRTITPRRNEKKSNKLTPQNPRPPQHKVRTIDTTPISRPPINYPPNTYPTKETHTPPFIDPLDIPIDKYL